MATLGKQFRQVAISAPQIEDGSIPREILYKLENTRLNPIACLRERGREGLVELLIEVKKFLDDALVHMEIIYA